MDEIQTDSHHNSSCNRKTMQSALAALDNASHSAASPLTRLPTVLVHLVMQQLQFVELARLASTCRLMRADSLHPSAGRFLRSFPKCRRTLFLEVHDVRTASPLARAHVAVTLALEQASHWLSAREILDAFLLLAARWAQVERLDVEWADWWSEADAIELLSALPRVTSVTCISGVWMREPVQSALCHLPLLSSLSPLSFGDSSHPSQRLPPSALMHATALRSLSYDRCDLPPLMLAGLICVPQLTALELSSYLAPKSEHPALGTIAWLHTHCRPMLSGLRALRLHRFNLEAQSRRDLRRFFGALNQLRYLSTERYTPDGVVSSLVDAGAVALPELRVVHFAQHTRDSPSISPPLLRRFLRLFPLVRYCLAARGDLAQRRAHERFALCERVCVKSDHAKPNDAGLCSECIERKPAQWVGTVALPMEPEALTDPQQEAELSALKAEAPAPLLSMEESLRLAESDYAAALAAAGPWEAPTRPKLESDDDD